MSPDYLEYLGHDDETRIIGAYVEGIREPERFLSVAVEGRQEEALDHSERREDFRWRGCRQAAHRLSGRQQRSLGGPVPSGGDRPGQ